ncbi:response regulator [Streptomyces spirodelae]|uniref:Response regulator transcription factor n=1 Tax=Streptomyces spirodelae TaxID=2812904 RepID=A0ABS3WWM0_9ACTN|nr:response regulator transcription factor [Streptomyces spirodelae]MBO8187514.1 response regulator transcription factor [Streptomyces spirodelae]
MSQSSAPVRVLIADDQELLRESFRVLVNAEPGLEVVGLAEDGDAAVRLAVRERPDVVLMDVRMPGLDGIEATRLIRSHPQAEGVRVLVLTMFDLDSYVFAALRSGASGFLLKDVAPADLVRAIRTVAAGQGLLAPSVTARLIAEFCRQPQATPEVSASLEPLTSREREVLLLVTKGLSNAEIAAELHVSMATVKTYIGRLFDKLGARDRVQLVITGYEHGLVTPSRRSNHP